LSITKVLLYACGLIILVLPYVVYALGGSLGCYSAILLFLLSVMWGLFSIRAPEKPTASLSKPVAGTESLPPEAEQLADNIISTYLGVMYDKARFMPDFHADNEMKGVLSKVCYVLQQHNLILSDETFAELRAQLSQAVQRGTADRK